MNATIKIVLKTDYVRQDGTVNIRLRLTINQRVKYYPLNIYILPKYFKSGRVLRGDIESFNKNMLIDKYINKANKIIFDYRINDTPITFENFDRDFTNKMYGSKSFYDFVDNQRIALKGKLTPGSLKGYLDQSNKMKDFKPTLLFKDINRQFINQYELFLIKERENKKNTITKSMKFIKSILNKAVLAGLIKENIFDKIPLGRTDGNREYLTTSELNGLSELYYKNELKPNKNNVLRYFLFCCYTGLRYSDIKNLRFADILENKYLSVQMIKTHEKVTIPLTDKAKKLIPKQYFKMQNVFKVLHDQPTNRYLKDIMKAAKINKSISFHCSRHTFATVSKTLGIEYDVISKILGHTDIKTTKVYTKYELSHLEMEMAKWGKL